jgi:hypothetical protein
LYFFCSLAFWNARDPISLGKCQYLSQDPFLGITAGSSDSRGLFVESLEGGLAKLEIDKGFRFESEQIQTPSAFESRANRASPGRCIGVSEVEKVKLIASFLERLTRKPWPIASLTSSACFFHYFSLVKFDTRFCLAGRGVGIGVV